MELGQARQLAFQLMEKYNLIQQGWRFEFNNCKVGLGICRHHNKTIELARYYTQHNTDEDIKDTILHEISHALTKGHGHDRIWKLKCMELGCTPRCQSKNAIIPEGRYKGVCPGCGKVFWKYRAKGGFQRLASRGCWCTHCGREKGRINWTDMEKNLTLYYVEPKNPNIGMLQNIIETANDCLRDRVPVLNLVQVSSAEARSLQEAREMARV